MSDYDFNLLVTGQHSGANHQVVVLKVSRLGLSLCPSPGPEHGLSGGLLASSRRDADQGGGPEQFVPANHNVRKVKVVQQYLSYSHEYFGALYPAVVSPNGNLRKTVSGRPVSQSSVT